MEHLKKQAVRGGAFKLLGQALTAVLRLVVLVVLARFLAPSDFGLVAMVTTITGIFSLFGDGGLSAAAIQRHHITNEQKSALFWINILIGAILTALCLAVAPLLASFYDEPRLFWITTVLSIGFIFSAACAQHTATLARELRYATLTLIEILSCIGQTVVAIAIAVAGFGYWALVAYVLLGPIVSFVSVWSVLGWIPNPPRRTAGIASMLSFGSTVTINRLVSHVTYNLDKVLLGRFWGAYSLGLYERAYQVINIPTAQLNAAIGNVAFSALSRLQHDPITLKRYFLRGYALVLSMTAPITFFAAVFADEIISIALGLNWSEAAAIFRLLTPTILVFGLINPTGWLLEAMGLQKRSLMIALVIAPICVTAYLIGLPYGPKGIAVAFSIAMSLWVVPHIFWCLKGTAILPRELFLTMVPPVGSAALAAAAAFAAQAYISHWESSLWRLALGGTVMCSVYGFMLFFVLGQGKFYLGLLTHLRTPRVS